MYTIAISLFQNLSAHGAFQSCQTWLPRALGLSDPADRWLFDVSPVLGTYCSERFAPTPGSCAYSWKKATIGHASESHGKLASQRLSQMHPNDMNIFLVWDTVFKIKHHKNWRNSENFWNMNSFKHLEMSFYFCMLHGQLAAFNAAKGRKIQLLCSKPDLSLIARLLLTWPFTKDFPTEEAASTLPHERLNCPASSDTLTVIACAKLLLANCNDVVSWHSGGK